MGAFSGCSDGLEEKKKKRKFKAMGKGQGARSER
jgi:hypothetical protein